MPSLSYEDIEQACQPGGPSCLASVTEQTHDCHRGHIRSFIRNGSGCDPGVVLVVRFLIGRATPSPRGLHLGAPNQVVPLDGHAVPAWTPLKGSKGRRTRKRWRLGARAVGSPFLSHDITDKIA